MTPEALKSLTIAASLSCALVDLAFGIATAKWTVKNAPGTNSDPGKRSCTSRRLLAFEP
jgi:hypothetical protein